MDATCALSDIRYPTDLSILNEARVDFSNSFVDYKSMLSELLLRLYA